MTEFKQRCLAVVRSVERTGGTVRITRRGRVVAQLRAAGTSKAPAAPPWERLRAAGGTLHATPEESIMHDTDFEAFR